MIQRSQLRECFFVATRFIGAGCGRRMCRYYSLHVDVVSVCAALGVPVADSLHERDLQLVVCTDANGRGDSKTKRRTPGQSAQTTGLSDRMSWEVLPLDYACLAGLLRSSPTATAGVAGAKRPRDANSTTNSNNGDSSCTTSSTNNNNNKKKLPTLHIGSSNVAGTTHRRGGTAFVAIAQGGNDCCQVVKGARIFGPGVRKLLRRHSGATTASSTVGGDPGGGYGDGGDSDDGLPITGLTTPRTQSERQDARQRFIEQKKRQQQESKAVDTLLQLLAPNGPVLSRSVTLKVRVCVRACVLVWHCRTHSGG